MAGFSATPEQLTTAATEMESENANLQNVLNQFISGAEGISGQWVGTAQTAFIQLAQRFKGDADKLNQALLQMSEQMTGTSKAYADQEAANQSAMTNITNRLDG